MQSDRMILWWQIVTRNLDETEVESLSEKSEPERREIHHIQEQEISRLCQKRWEKYCARGKHFLLAGDSDWIGRIPKQAVEQNQDLAHQE